MRLENEYQAVKFKKVKGAEFIPYTYFRGALEILLLVMITLLEEIKGWPSGEATQRDLTDLSLEELMSIEVTSVSKKEQTVFLTPAAVHSYTSWEIQPSAKLMWTPHHRHALWTGVSRAVRMPARTNSDFRINFAAFPDPTSLLTLISIFGNPDLSAEDLLAYELGYRFQPKSSLSFDVATFYNVYKDLMSTLWTTLASPAIRGWTPDWDGGRGARSSSVSFSKISSIPNIKNSVASSAA